MTDVAKRRRWPWRILAAVLVLSGGVIAWQFRPHNSIERGLVGTWAGTKPEPARLVFDPDGRYRGVMFHTVRDKTGRRNLALQPVQEGRWKVTRMGGLVLHVRDLLEERDGSTEMPLQIRGPDRIAISGFEFLRVRE